jgi:O-antigen/teichoic acid export membrane protein
MNEARIHLSSISGGMLTVLNAGLTFVSIPILISVLGSEKYGVLALMSAVGGVNTFLNLGLASSLTKSIAEQEDKNESNLDILVTISLLAALLLPTTAIALLLKRPILTTVLGLPDEIATQAESLFLCLVFSNLLGILGQCATAILDAKGKIYQTNLLQGAHSIMYWALTVAMVLVYKDLSSVGIGQLAAYCIWFLLVLRRARAVWGPFALRGVKKNYLRIAKKQVTYGMQIYASGVIGYLYEPLTRILVSHTLGLREVGFLDIALRVRTAVLGMIGRMIYPIFPLFAGTSDISKIDRIVNDLQVKLAFIIAPTIALVILLSGPLVSIWINHDVEAIASAVMWIVTAHLVAMMALPTHHFLIAKGLASRAIILQANNGIMNAAIILLTYTSLGFASAILGNVAAILSTFCLSLLFQRNHLQRVELFAGRNPLKILTVFAVSCLVGKIGIVTMDSDWNRLLAVPAIGAISALLLYRTLAIFTEADLARYTGNSPFLMRWGKRILVGSRASE